MEFVAQKNEVEKSQGVRLLDVLVVGPTLIFLASRGRQLSWIERLTLAGIGIGTVIYNWQNYQANKG